MNNMNPFPALAAPCLFIFPSNLSNTDKVALAAYLGQKSSAKETERSSNDFLPKLPIILAIT